MFRKKRDPKPTRGSVQLRDPPAARDRRLAQRLDPDADADGTAPPHKQKPHPLTLPDNLPPLPLARASLLRKTMLDADLERRLSDALRHLLASPELPWTPFPSLIRQLRRDEARLAMQRGKPTVEEAGRLVWSTGRRVRSALDQRLVTYTPRGSAWLSLVPLLDRSAVDRVAGQLATSNLLASFSTTQATPRGELTLRTTTCIRGEQLFAPRLIPYASTFDLAEHVHVDGPAGMLGEAISLFEQRLVDTALMINDSDEQLFELVEVPQPRQGGGGGDGEDAAREDVPEAQFESKADDTAHFELGELRQKPLSSKLRKAILAAVLHGLPVYLRLLVLVPVFEDTTAVADTSTAGASADGDARGGGSSAPRWEYARLRKAFFLSFSPIGRVAAFAPSAMGGESLPERCAPPKEALLYTCSWTSEREAASYLATVQQRLASGMEESRRQYAKFAFDDLANLLARTNYNALLIQLVLLLPHFKNEIESRSILGELYLYFRSDAAVVEEIADALAAVRLALDCCADGRVSKAKRARVLSVVSRQFIHHSRLLLRIVQSDEWTDAAALAAPLGALVQSVGEDLGGLAEGDGKHGALVAAERYARMLHAERADAVVSNCKRAVEIVSNAWKENEGAAIPVSLAPRARRERVIDVENECRRHAKLGTYSADSLRESVLLQYVVDTGVDASIRRALTTTCEAPVILPNPFSTALRVLKEAASEFEVHRAPDSVVAAAWAAHAGPCELELEPSLRVYAAPTPPPPLPPTTAAMASPIVDRLGEILNADEPTGHSAAVAASVYGGPAQVTYADRVGLHALRAEIGDELMAVRMRSVVHGFETHYFCCYDDVASAMDRAPAGTRYAARIREDHFVRAGSLSEAVLVHCHRVLAVILRLHRDTMHLVGTIQLGDARWTIGDVLFDQRLAFGEMTNAVNAGGSLSIEVSVHVIDPTAGDEAAKGERARQRRTEGPAHPLPRAPNRYVAVSKQFHLVALTQGGERGYQQLVTCIPRRSGTFHRSVFLSRVHALAAGAVEQHSERRGAVAGGARERVRLEGCTALRSGDALGACRCFLRLRAIDRDRFDKETRARCARLLSCAAANLESFRRLSMAIRHALRACEVDESLNKSYSTTLAAMIDTLRSHVCGYLDADECCDFQLVRFDVQAAFYAIFKRVRTHGALSPSLLPHLELVEHYVHGVELAIGHRVMLASGELVDGLDVAFEFSGKKPAVPGRRASESTHK